MSEWLQALPAFLLTLALLFVPGAAIAYAVGVRGLLAWGAAPALGMSVLSVSPVVITVLGPSWSPGILVACVVLSLLAAVAVGLWRRHRVTETPPSRTGRRVHLLAAVGVAVGAVAILAAVIPGAGSPDDFVQSPDAVYHLNRLRLFVDSGDFSSVASPFYPSGFHDVAASVMQVLPGLGVMSAGNLMAFAAAAVVWPVGCVLAARYLLGGGGLVLVGAGLASATFAIFPYLLLGWGVLWPNLLATALLPALLPPLLVLTGTIPEQPGLRRTDAWLVLVLGIPGLTLTHPNGLISLVMIAVTVVVTGLVASAVREQGPKRRRAIVLSTLLVVGAAAVLVALPRISVSVANTASNVSSPYLSIGSALNNSVLFTFESGVPRWGLVAVLLLGIVGCARERRLRWLLSVYAVCLAVYVVSATGRTAVGVLITGYWYNDKMRLLALTAVPAALVAVVGVTVLARLVRRALTYLRGRFGGDAAAGWPSRTLVGLLALVAVVGLTLGLDHRLTTRQIASYYHPTAADKVLLDADQRADLGRIAAQIPKGVVTADAPSNGSGLLYALYDKPVLFDNVLLSPDPDDSLIGLNLRDVATRTDVCDSLRRKNVQYVITGEVTYVIDYAERTAGLRDIAGQPGFTLVTSAGGYQLYRITACGFSDEAVPAGQ